MLERSIRKVRLTSLGESYYEFCRRGLQALAAVEADWVISEGELAMEVVQLETPVSGVFDGGIVGAHSAMEAHTAGDRIVVTTD